MTTADTWGWAGTVREFLSTPVDVWRRSLASHHLRLLMTNHSSSQDVAWTDAHAAIADALKSAATVGGDVLEWSLVFEYELPLEGGRRPDVVLLAGGTVIVIECKSAGVVLAADVDQVEAYARDIADYHKESHGRTVVPVLLLVGGKGHAELRGDVIATSPDGLAKYLVDNAGEETVDLSAWLTSPYEPLPTLVAAAKRIFKHEPLPHVYTALSAGIPQTVDRLVEICNSTEGEQGRTLAFVTGVPGSGKTLVGLRLVYERSTMEGKAAFLSGNGPLVDVLQDALKSSVFVKDLHKVVLSYGKQGKLPRENILVFDEAQRAWDVDQVARRHDITKSEPDLLIGIGEKVPEWAVLVGLVGEGQEIHTGEEAGIGQWAEAIAPPNATASWKVWCAEKLRETFAAHDVSCDDQLDLTVSLRSRRAEVLHAWVADVIDGTAASLSAAARKAAAIQTEGFPMYLTRDLDEAKDYARWRYREEPDRRYGLVASSHAKVLPKFGIDNGFQATNRLMNFGRWYNAPRDDPRSCCALSIPVTEFGCQGLELDLPIVCWGEDMRWTGTFWELTPIRRRVRQEDPQQLLRNTYRVLLTRGRDGFVVYVPDDRRLDQTELALLAAGLKPVPAPVALPGAVGGAA